MFWGVSSTTRTLGGWSIAYLPADRLGGRVGCFSPSILSGRNRAEAANQLHEPPAVELAFLSQQVVAADRLHQVPGSSERKTLAPLVEHRDDDDRDVGDGRIGFGSSQELPAIYPGQ